MSDEIKDAFEERSPSDTIGNGVSKKNQNKIVLVLLGIVFVIMAILMFGNFGGPKKQNRNTSVTQGTTNDYPSVQPASYAASVPVGNVTDKVNALQLENEEIRRSLDVLQKQNQAMYEELVTRLNTNTSVSGGGNTTPLSAMSRLSSIDERFSADYQAKVQHFKGNRENYWQIPDDQLVAMRTTTNTTDTGAGNIYQSQNNGIFSYMIPAGTRLIVITEQPVNTDHPGYFTSRIIRPYILKDAKLICQSGSNQNDRIPVSPIKIVFNNKEIPITGQAEMDFPGLTGSVKNHWPSRLLPTMVNSAIAGSFIAWSASQSNETRINTQDAITSSVVEQTVPGVQNEISRFGGDRPNTVQVPQGQQFTILLTDKLEVRY
jgi:hypothetical protein